MYIIKEPEYWRITDAVEKVIAKHTYAINCEQIIKAATQDERPFLFAFYICQLAAESARFAAAIRSSSKPKTEKRIYEFKSCEPQAITAEDMRKFLADESIVQLS